MFLILVKTVFRHADISSLRVLGSFSSSDKADEAIIAQVGEFNQCEDGGGTRFIRVDEEGFVEKDGYYYFRLDSIGKYYPTPAEVKDRLEPY